MRTVDLAREHGLSTQAVRNYEDAGAIPAAHRTASGYRTWTPRHAAALRAYIGLIPGHGHRAAGQVMVAVHDGDLGTALAVIDDGHARLSSDRDTLLAVRSAIDLLVADGPIERPAEGTPERTLSVGMLAARLQVSPATLRAWERAGILRPQRRPHTRQRRYGADDIRDAELAHLLRRGHQPLARIAVVIDQIRGAGGAAELAATLDNWEQRLTHRGRSLLQGAALLSRYLDEQ